VGLANYYPLFLGPKVEAQDRDGTNSVTAFCGYHRAFGSSNTTLLVYADIPYTGDGCTEGQAPNGDLDADGAVNVLSHETNEAVTDPTDKSAWVDQAANEIGDMCSDTFGAPLGSTSAASPKTTLYNQVINGAKYYTQREFSDVAFDKLGDGSGCVQSEAQAQSLENSGVGTNAAGVSAVFADAYPTTLSNSGSTSKINISVADGNGDAVQGDQVHFSVGNLYDDGDGDCGTLTKADTKTDADGSASVTYTASKSNVACWVLVTEIDGGLSAESVLYQGTAGKDAPTFTDTFPATMQPGAAATFTMTATNNTGKAIPAVRADFYIWSGTPKAKSIDASQVQVAYSTTGPNGTFTNVALSGSTADGNPISGDLGPAGGGPLAAQTPVVYTVKVTLAPGVPTSSAGPLVSFEGYLNQIDSASGSSATLADTTASDVKVK
jgi:hypothetical protein